MEPSNSSSILGQPFGIYFTNTGNPIETQPQKIQFKIIHNDQSRENMKYLLDLKNIFGRQLPKMPKQYIAKLVFDKKHESLIILKKQKVIGGVCFRVFEAQKFVEVVFLAVTATEQVQGYGTKIMNHLKNQMQKRQIEYMMTYADNLALGYFVKQGFTKQYKMPQQRWKGYIKDYEDGTMMQCYIHPKINYLTITDQLKRQKQIILEKIKQISLNQIPYDGKLLEKLRNNKLEKMQQNEEVEYRIDPREIPGVMESGWSPEQHQELKKNQQVTFQTQCANIIDLLKKHPSSWPFREPVSASEAPDYSKIIKQPIDLKTIERKIIVGEYTQRQQFQSDIRRMFSNARLYNGPSSYYYKVAKQVQDFISGHLQKFLKGNELDSGQMGKPNKSVIIKKKK